MLNFTQTRYIYRVWNHFKLGTRAGTQEQITDISATLHSTLCKPISYFLAFLVSGYKIVPDDFENIYWDLNQLSEKSVKQFRSDATKI